MEIRAVWNRWRKIDSHLVAVVIHRDVGQLSTKPVYAAYLNHIQLL